MTSFVAKLVKFASDHPILTIVLGILSGGVYGLIVTLRSGSLFFNFDPIVDGSMYGAFVGVIAWLIAKFLALVLPVAATDEQGSMGHSAKKTWKELVYPKFMLFEETKAKSRAAKLSTRRNSIGVGMGLVALTTLIQAVNSPNPAFPIIGGGTIIAFLFAFFALTSAKIDRLSGQSDLPDVPGDD